MARIRTIKPEFWTDEIVGECSPSARLVFIASWNFADDQGNLERSAKQLKAKALPYDNIDCELLLQELIGAGLMVEYEAGAKKYLHIKGFLVHQKIDNPARARLPLYINGEASRSPPLVLPEDSRLKGREGIKEGKGSRKGKDPESPPAPVFVAPEGLDPDAWIQWLTYRQSIAKPLKPASLAVAAKQMATLGPLQADAVQNSIANGYTGLIVPKANQMPKERPRWT